MSLKVDNINQPVAGLIQNPTSILPGEVVLEIFSRLNLATLGAICTVNRKWKDFASEPNLLKQVMYKEVAFGNDKWARSGGQDLVKDEDYNEEFASLPLNEFISDCKKFKIIFPEKSAKDTLMLVRIPKNLTVKKLGELAKRYFPGTANGYQYIEDVILEWLGDKSMDKSRWVVMTKDLLPESRKESYDKQKKRIADLALQDIIGYGFPEAPVAAACILAQYFDSKTCLFSNSPYTLTRCEENVQGQQVIVGGFAPVGLRVYCFAYSAHDFVGVAALRKF